MKQIISRFSPQNFNDLLAFLYFPFVIVWIIMLAIIYVFVDRSFVTVMGLSTATGVILAKFNDLYQFYFRKQKDAEPSTLETKTVTESVSTTCQDKDK